MHNIFFTPEFVAAEHTFSTTRKALWVAESLQHSPIENAVVKACEPLAYDALLTVHERAYVEAVRTGVPKSLACSQGFTWGPQLLPAMLASNGGVVAAALDALVSGVSGSLSSGLHHARHHRGLAFCTFNGLVLAALAALNAGARRVLILDLDAHGGGGTAALIMNSPRLYQVDVSVSSFDTYRNTDNAKLIMADGDSYLDVVAQALHATNRSEFDLCLYNAGMDPLAEDTCGGALGITDQTLAAREKLVFDWASMGNLPIAYVLAGGYVGGKVNQSTLVALHRLTISAAAAVPRT